MVIQCDRNTTIFHSLASQYERNTLNIMFLPLVIHELDLRDKYLLNNVYSEEYRGMLTKIRSI